MRPSIYYTAPHLPCMICNELSIHRGEPFLINIDNSTNEFGCINHLCKNNYKIRLKENLIIYHNFWKQLYEQAYQQALEYDNSILNNKILLTQDEFINKHFFIEIDSIENVIKKHKLDQIDYKNYKKTQESYNDLFLLFKGAVFIFTVYHLIKVINSVTFY